ncbi:MAG: HAD family hydrolase [Acidimicrobiales bacterium]
MSAPVRLVATDLDGTLLGAGGRVGRRTRDALHAARDAGVLVVPVTGRPPEGMWPVITGCALGPLGVCSNGAVLVDVEARAVLEVVRIGAEVASRLVGVLRQVVPGILLASDNLDGFVYERGFFPGPVDWEDRLTEVDDIAPATLGGCVKLVARRAGWSAPDLVATLQSELAEEAHVTTSGLDWVDVGLLGITKAYALDRLCDRLEVSVAEVVAVGDNHNDLPVLGWAGTAMAPANAIPEVLAMVDRVLPANTDDGVAVLLEELAGRRA